MADGPDAANLRRALPRLGLWTTAQNRVPLASLRRAAAVLDGGPVGQLWVGEGGGRDPFLAVAAAVGAGEALWGGVGVASVHARDAVAAVACERDVLDNADGRLVVGYGVSHPGQAAARGARYAGPLATMRRYLSCLDRADELYAGPVGRRPPRLVGALGPRMLALAAERAQGTQTYCVPVRHTEQARTALGPAPILVVEQAVAVGPAAERLAAAYVDGCLAHENYVRSLRRLGYSEDDLEGPSRRLIHALVSVGADAIAPRVADHLAAGADQVAVQVLDERAVATADATSLAALWSEAAALLAPVAARRPIARRGEPSIAG